VVRELLRLLKKECHVAHEGIAPLLVLVELLNTNQLRWFKRWVRAFKCLVGRQNKQVHKQRNFSYADDPHGLASKKKGRKLEKDRKEKENTWGTSVPGAA
jgi:hypothetical protein